MPLRLEKVWKWIQTFKNSKNTIFALRAKITVFDVFEGRDRFRDLPQHHRHQVKLPEALPRPQKGTNTPKTQNPEKPSEGDLRREGRGSSKNLAKTPKARNQGKILGTGG